MRRLFDLTVVTIWLLSLAGLVWHDLWPTWSAGAPPVQVPGGPDDHSVRMQFQIETSRWGRLGRSWAEFWRVQDSAIARSTTLLEGGPLRRPIRVETNLSYDPADRLDELKVWVYGLPMPVQIQAASYGEDFPCIVTVGPQRHEFTLRQDMASAFAEVFRPFVYLKGLSVGKTWRIASINPLGSLWGEQPDPVPVVARVTRRETIEHLGRSVECFRVEAQGATAWVNDDGEVLRQEVDVPMLGKTVIRLLDGFDEQALQQAREQVSQW